MFILFFIFKSLKEGGNGGAISVEFGRKIEGSFLQNSGNTEVISYMVETTACDSESERSKLQPCVMAELFCRETPAERLGWAQQRREEAGKWTVMQAWHTEAGTGSRIASSVHPRPPSQPPALSTATIKAGKGTWQVEGAEVMASAQRRCLELLKKRTVSQRARGESRHSHSRTVWVFVVCMSVWLETCGLSKLFLTLHFLSVSLFCLSITM